MRQKHVRHLRESVKETYAVIAPEFDRTRREPWEEFSHFLAYVRKGDRVLDAGCGNGRLLALLAKKQVRYLGVDNNSALLEKAREHFPDARFEWQDIAALSLEEGAFDVAFCVAAFHHLPGRRERQKAAAHLHRVLREGGVLVLTVWNLFQRKYAGALFRAALSWGLHLGLRYAWNDVWVRWGGAPLKRYYHAFLPGELLRYFSENLWEIEEFYFTRKGERVSFWRSFNLVMIARKK